MDENNKITDLEKVNYSFDMLLNDIVTVPTEDKGKPESDDKNLREYHLKMIKKKIFHIDHFRVICFLFLKIHNLIIRGIT